MRQDPAWGEAGSSLDATICASRCAWAAPPESPGGRHEGDRDPRARRSRGGEPPELPDPVPKPGEVVVAVKAAALNHLDIWVRTGWQGLRLAFPHVLGSDVAGVIEAIGAGVEGVKVGDAVVVNPSLGCSRCEPLLGQREPLPALRDPRRARLGRMAERLAVSARNVLPKPENLSFVEAAAIPSRS